MLQTPSDPTVPLAAELSFRHPRERELATVANEARSWAFKVRVSSLLSVLLVVLLYAAHDWLGRRERTKWERPLNVALIVVQESAVADNAISALRERIHTLEAQLDAEFRRYRPAGPRPFEFMLYGPVDARTPPPEHEAEGVWELVRYAWALLQFTRDVDKRALVPTRGFDARLYLVVRPPANMQQSTVEGAGEQGGRVGVAKVELADDMIDFALFVAAHELFHNLGATDKYRSNGHTLVPDGLAEPEISPRFPQAKAEIMARNRPLSAETEEPPTSLEQLGIGPLTAAEVGWTH